MCRSFVHVIDSFQSVKCVLCSTQTSRDELYAENTYKLWILVGIPVTDVSMGLLDKLY